VFAERGNEGPAGGVDGAGAAELDDAAYVAKYRELKTNKLDL
jgi:hypothetical protein